MKKAKHSNDSILKQEVLSEAFFQKREHFNSDGDKTGLDSNTKISQKDKGPDGKTNERDMLLWAKIKEGEVTALGDLYDLYINDLFPYGLVLCSDKHLIMDCIHDLFVDLFKYRKKLTDEPQVKYYLLKSLRRKIFKKTTNKKKKFSELRDNIFVDLNLFETSAEKKLIDHEIDIDKKVLIVRALDGLPKKQKMAIQMKFYEGRSYEEIAALMSITIETARTLIYRSLVNLRKVIHNPFLYLLFLLCLL